MRPDSKKIVVENYAMLPDFMSEYGYRTSPIRTPLQLSTDKVRRLIAADLDIVVKEVIIVNDVIQEAVILTLENCEKTYSEIRKENGNPLNVEFLTEENTGGATTFEEVITPTEEVVVPAEEVITPAEEVVVPAEEVITPAEEVVVPAEAPKSKKDKHANK